MGKLAEQTIPTLFGGVSRQPASVRRVNQVETADNTLMSVVTGGFEKRPASQLIDKLSYIDADKEYRVHPVDRDPTNQLFFAINSEGIQAINTITGAEIDVATGDSTRYFLIEQENINSTGIVQLDGADMSLQLQPDSTETTFAWDFALSDTGTVFKIEGSADGVTWNDIATGKTGASGTFNTTIGAVATDDHNYIRVNITTGAAAADDTITLKATFKDLTYLLGADPEDFQVATVADTSFVTNRTVKTRMAEADSGTITSTVQKFADLPSPTGSGNIHRVEGTDADGFGTYFVIDDATNSVWDEHVDPTAHNSFDASSLPHTITRQTDGTFIFAAAAWEDRRAGDEDITEEPAFIGKEIQDVAFFRNRLTFLADEEVYTSQSGSVFDMWPEKATEVLDTDPISRAATTSDINILKFAAVFRKTLFLTSSAAQFELNSESKFTPETAVLDLVTTYAASPIAKPKAMQDSLYFAAKSAETAAIIYEYFTDEITLTSKAAEITKHVVNYIPSDVLQIASDPATNTLYILSTGEQNSLYVYRTFFDGTEKLQSSWARYTYGSTEADAYIHGMAVFSGYLVLMIERDDGAIYLEQAPVETEDADADLGFIPLLDQREVVTGTYDSGNDVTSWDLTFEHKDDAQVITGPAFTEPGYDPPMFYPDRYTLTLSSVAAGETIVINGLTFTAHASTTTTADREFDISGNDTADAGELATVINDGTDGLPGVTATDNADGTLTLNVDDAADGSITTPTGTAIDNATIVAVEKGDIVAARTDLTAGDVWIGRPYTMSVQLSKLYFRNREGAAVITGRLQLKDITFLLEDTGYIKVEVTPTARDAYEYTFEGKTLGSEDTTIGSPAIAESTSFKVPVYANSEKVTITLSNDQPQPCVVTAAAWRGFFNELSRQE